MQQEVEAKFLDINHDEVRDRLRQLGANLEKPMRLMRRVMLDYPDSRFQKSNHSRQLRVRDEGDKVTVTYKSRTDSQYADETEFTADSFDVAVQLFENIGLQVYSFQESKRETWHLDDVEVVLDEWPWLNPYIEIEGPDESSIKSAAAKLGFDWTAAYFGTVDTAYKHQYPKIADDDSVGDLPEVRFDTPLPQYFIDRQ